MAGRDGDLSAPPGESGEDDRGGDDGNHLYIYLADTSNVFN